MTVPQNIRALRDEACLEIEWPDGAVHRLPYRFLRGRCPCAACVNEFTGERMVGVDDVPEQVRPANLAFSGNYALKIEWNDAHQTGLFTWEYLARLAAEAPAER